MKKILTSFSSAIFASLLILCVSPDVSGEKTDDDNGAEDKTVETQAKEKENKGTTSSLHFSDEERLKIAETYADEILTSIKTNDFDAYFKNFTTEAKEKNTRKSFTERNKEFLEQCGEYQSREYLGVLKKQVFDIYLWKAKFSKLPNDDILIRMFLVEDSDQLKVYAFSIKPF
jgi:hypothetical protein